MRRVLTPEEMEAFKRAEAHVQAAKSNGSPRTLEAVARREGYGEELLDRVESFLGRFVVYPSDHARVAHVLWIAHTHGMPVWDSTPRLFFESPEPGSGKTRALEVTEILVPRPVLAVNVTPAYLFRKVAAESGLPTILHDEIDTIFGAKAKEHEDVRGLLNAGHRKGQITGRCAVHGKTIVTEDIEAYCAVAMAGLGDLPDTLMTRSVVIRMQRRGAGEDVEPFRRRQVEEEAELLRGELTQCAGTFRGGAWPQMPAGIKDRDADVWESLLMVAETAGGRWPKLARQAAVTMVEAAKHANPSYGVLLLRDLQEIFGDQDAMFSATILEKLLALEESPWSDIRGRPLNALSLSMRLKKYQTREGEPIRPRQVRVGGIQQRGYERADLSSAWDRYLPRDGSEPTTHRLKRV